VFPFFPRAWDHLIQQTPDISVLLMAGEMMYLRNQQRDLAQAFAHPIVQYSVTLQFIWSLRNRSQQHDIDENTLALTKLRTAKELPFAVRGPELENLDGDGIYDTIAQQWARSSIQMRSLCHAYGSRDPRGPELPLPNRCREGLPEALGEGGRTAREWRRVPRPASRVRRGRRTALCGHVLPLQPPRQHHPRQEDCCGGSGSVLTGR
jgi:hypothetical protein